MKAYRRMMIRGVGGSVTRFLSILCISALGVGFLCGLLSTEPDMKQGADEYYRAQNTMDLRIIGSLGLTDEDVAALEEQKDIKQVQGKHLLDLLLLDDNEESYVARVIDYDFADEDNINQVILTEGRLPEKPGECLLEVPNIYAYDLSTDQILTIDPENEDYEGLVETLGDQGFKVVGFAMSPHFVSMFGERTNVGDGEVVMGVYVTPETFHQDYYTALFATASGTEGMNTYDQSYKDYTDDLEDELKPFGEERSKVRREQLVAEATAEYEKAKSEYESERAKAESELASAKAELDRALAQIQSGQKKLSDGEKQIAANEKTLQATQKQLDASKAEIEQLKAMQAQGMELPEEALQSIAAYDQGVAQVAAGQKQLAAAKEELAKNRQQLATARTQYDQGKAEYDSAYQKAQEEFAKAEAELAKAKEDIENIPSGKWSFATRRDIYGINSYEGDAEKIGAIAKVFPVFFFLVAALVAMTTMTRLMDEERGRIGTLKSLGYGNRKILSYYLGYSLTAALLGCLIGIPLGSWLFPKVISNAYKMMYVLPALSPSIRWNIALPVSLLLTGLIVAVTAGSCHGILKDKPAILLLPKAPKAGKRILLEHVTPLWRRFTFSQKVTLRNIFRYKKRFFMTILGVAGCFALLLAGFGIRDSIGDIVELQYGAVYHFDNTMEMKADGDDAADETIAAVLSDGSLVTGHLTVAEESITLEKGRESFTVNVVVPKNTEIFGDYVTLRERVGGTSLPLDNKGAVLTEKAAGELGVSVGDEVSIPNEQGEDATVTVTGICENYVSSYLYMTPEVYQSTFQKAPAYKMLWIKAAEGKEDDVSAAMFKSDQTVYIYDNETVTANFRESMGSIDNIVRVLIISAAALAIIVLYSLTNINVCERKKELATVKVLGFYARETRNYIFREVNLLTVLGSLVGIPVGLALHSFVIRTAEVDNIMFGRSVYWQSYVFALGMTLLFALIVNIIMRRSINKIDMVESMKAVD